jgi:hypothetical protein
MESAVVEELAAKVLSHPVAFDAVVPNVASGKEVDLPVLTSDREPGAATAGTV